jgi:DNA-directed RNA polymerase specialized sigma24 family protein
LPKVKKLIYDVALLRRAAVGNKAAVEKIIGSSRLWGEVKGFLIYEFNLRGDSLEDAVESSIRKVRRGLLRGKFDVERHPDGDINAWVKEVAKNAARDYFRRQKAQKRGANVAHTSYDTVNEFDVAAGPAEYYCITDNAAGDGEDTGSFVEAFEPENRNDRVAGIYEPEAEADNFLERQVKDAAKLSPKKQRGRVTAFLKAFEFKDRGARAAAVNNAVPTGVYVWYDYLHTIYRAAADIGPGREYVQKSYKPNPYINALRGPQYHINLLLYKCSRFYPIKFDERPRKSAEEAKRDGALATRVGRYLNAIDRLPRSAYDSRHGEAKQDGPPKSKDYGLNSGWLYIRGNWRKVRFNGNGGADSSTPPQKKDVVTCRKGRDNVTYYAGRKIGPIFVGVRYDF